MTAFLDLLEAFHHWCVSEDTTRLEGLHEALGALVPTPASPMDWYQLGTGALGGLTMCPGDWEPHWRILSAHERSLTVDALEYLEARRPGAIAAAIEQPSAAPLQASAPPVPKPIGLSDVPVHWSLSDVINCVSREVQKRETTYPHLVQQGRLSPSRARQELGQMKAALEILLAMRDKGQDARQQSLFD